MATHGYIKIDRGSKEKSTMIHAFHDGYMGNMLNDIFSIPTFIHKYLKDAAETKGRNDYKYDMFSRYRDDRPIESFEKLIDLWNSVIPLDSIEYTFESFMITQDPLMYAIDYTDAKNGDIDIKFGKGRLPSCTITINEEEVYPDEEQPRYETYMDNLNSKIYLDDNKVKKLPDGSYFMEIDKIVCDLIWQDVNPAVQRDKKLSQIV